MAAVVTAVGLSRIVGSGSETFKYVALGTGTTAPSEQDEALVNEIARVRASQNYAIGAIMYIEATFPAGVATSDNINEYGVFDAEDGGSLLLRGTFPSPKVKEDNEAITMTISVSIGNV